MAVSNPFFTKREPQSFNRPSTVGTLNSSSSTNVLNTVSEPVTRAPEPAPAPVNTATAAAPDQGGSKLTVGPNIKLKGVEITDCDTLVVEGTVEATMDSRVIQIAQQGAFHGSADIDIAEIHGEFEGTLTVRQKLLIHSTGKVRGKIRYGNIVIEEGGQLSGEIEVGVTSRSSDKAHKPSSTSTPLSAAA